MAGDIKAKLGASAAAITITLNALADDGARDADHNLDGSLADITALTGDVLRFLCEDGTRWVLISNNSAAADNN